MVPITSEITGSIRTTRINNTIAIMVIAVCRTIKVSLMLVSSRCGLVQPRRRGLRVAELREDLLVVLPNLGYGGDDRLRAGQGGRGSEPAQRTHRRAELAPAVSRLQLGVIQELPHGAYPGIGHPGRFEPLDHFPGGEIGKDLFYLGVQRVAVLYTPGVRVEAAVLRHPLAPQDFLTEPLPLAFVLNTQEDALAIRAPERPVGRYGGVRSAAAPGLLAAIPGEVSREAHPLAERLQHRDLQRRAIARPLAPEEGGEDAGVGVHPRGDVRGGDADLGGRLGRAGDGDQASLALHEQIVGLLLGVRSALTVARDGAVHQPGVLGPHLVCAEAEAPGRARGEVLDHDVGAGHKAAQDLSSLILLQVQGQRFLGAVEPDEVAGHAPDRFVVTPGEVPDPGALDLYDPRAEVCELTGGEGGGHGLFEGDDVYS